MNKKNVDVQSSMPAIKQTSHLEKFILVSVSVMAAFVLCKTTLRMSKKLILNDKKICALSRENIGNIGFQKDSRNEILSLHCDKANKIEKFKESAIKPMIWGFVVLSCFFRRKSETL